MAIDSPCLYPFAVPGGKTLFTFAVFFDVAKSSNSGGKAKEKEKKIHASSLW
jgi:hypothetical protein